MHDKHSVVLNQYLYISNANLVNGRRPMTSMGSQLQDIVDGPGQIQNKMESQAKLSLMTVAKLWVACRND